MENNNAIALSQFVCQHRIYIISRAISLACYLSLSFSLCVSLSLCPIERASKACQVGLLCQLILLSSSISSMWGGTTACTESAYTPGKNLAAHNRSIKYFSR